MNSSGSSYRLPRSAAETRRLMRQHQLYAPLTRAFFVGAGIAAGMTVLDLGCGAGDVSLLVAELVGPRGRVVGVDADEAILDTARQRAASAGWEQVELRTADVSRLDLPERFDAVVGRWILMHTEDPVEVLRRAAAHLRPGGVLAVQDSDYSVSARCFAHPPTPTHDRLAAVLFPTALFPAATAGEGPVANLGLSLYGMFRQAGLPDPQLRLEAPLGGGEDWPGYAYLAETVASLLPALRALGVPGVDDIELAGLEARLRREVVERNGVQVLPTVIGAWARV